jgi:serine O-acetyltransferase
MLPGVRADVDRYRVGSRQSTLRLVVLNQGLWALFVYRLFAPMLRSDRRVPRVAAKVIGVPAGKLVEVLSGIMLPLRAEIGHGLYIAHFGGVIVNEASVVGRNCTIMHGVTLGNSGRWDRSDDAPHLGDRVYVGAGACVLGSIEIGEDAVVGANAVVNRSLDARAVAVGAPASVISHRGSFAYVAYDGMHEDARRSASLARAER